MFYQHFVRVAAVLPNEYTEQIKKHVLEEIRLMVIRDEVVDNFKFNFKRKIENHGGELDMKTGEVRFMMDGQTSEHGFDQVMKETEKLNELLEKYNEMNIAAQERTNYWIDEKADEYLDMCEDGVKDNEEIVYLDVWTGIIYAIPSAYVDQKQVIDEQYEMAEYSFLQGIEYITRDP